MNHDEHASLNTNYGAAVFSGDAWYAPPSTGHGSRAGLPQLLTHISIHQSRLR